MSIAEHNSELILIAGVEMKTSTSRILTTHTGSLPRNEAMQGLLRTRQDRLELDMDVFTAETENAVTEVTQKQMEIGIDVINDGEQGRAQYATYVKGRLTGFDGEMKKLARRSLEEEELSLIQI